jgi:hypothetical protein
MTWRCNNAVENYVLINKLLPQVQKTLWICAKNILNSRLSILFKIAHWLRHRRGDVGRPPLWRIVCSSLQITKNTTNQRSTRHRTENCSNSLAPSVGTTNRSLQKKKKTEWWLAIISRLSSTEANSHRSGFTCNKYDRFILSWHQIDTHPIKNEISLF